MIDHPVTDPVDIGPCQGEIILLRLDLCSHQQYIGKTDDKHIDGGSGRPLDIIAVYIGFCIPVNILDRCKGSGIGLVTDPVLPGMIAIV